MKFLSTLVASLSLIANVPGIMAAPWDGCEVPKVDWLVTDQGTGSSMAYALIPEPTGVWIAGSFQSTLKIQGPSGSISLTSALTHSEKTVDDIYIAKVGLDGSVKTALAFEGPGKQLIIDGSFDSTSGSERLIIAGYHLGNLTFGAGFPIRNTKSADSGWYDGFIASIDVSVSGQSPTAVWAMPYVNSRGTKYSGVSTANGQNIVGVGNTCAENTSGTKDPNTGLFPEVCSGFIISLNKDNGNKVWEKVTANYFPETVRHDGSIAYVTGTLKKPQEFITTRDGTITLTPTGTSDVVVLKINTVNGDITYAVKFGVATKSYSAWEINIGTNNFYLTGSKTKADYDGYLIKASKSDGVQVYNIDVPSARGCQIDSTETNVYLMGLFQSSITLSSSLTLRSRGSYEIFVLKFAASNGEGRWGMTLGGDGMEYPWSMFKDANNDIYVSGLTASSTAKFGDKNFIDVAVNYNNMFLTKIKTSVEALPSCLSSCSTVTSGCYIDGECHVEDASSPFQSHGCFKCKPAINTKAWIGPDTASGSWCYIDSACVSNNKYRDIAVTSGTKQSKCQKCDSPKSGSAWTLLAGYVLDTDGKTCKSDGSIPAGSVTPGCSGTQTRNENFCGTVTPCYDAATDSCHAAISVCPNGAIYSESCPTFPLKPCYVASSNSCVDSTYKTSTDTVNCGATGRYIYVDKCPTAHPCYDHIDRVCTAAQKNNDVKAAAGKENIEVGVTLFTVVVSIIMLIVA